MRLIALRYIWLFLGICRCSPLWVERLALRRYNWGVFRTIGTLKYSVQDVAGEVCMSDNRMASSECSKVGSQFNTLPAPSVSCVDVLANRVLGSWEYKRCRFWASFTWVVAAHCYLHCRGENRIARRWNGSTQFWLRYSSCTGQGLENRVVRALSVLQVARIWIELEQFQAAHMQL